MSEETTNPEVLPTPETVEPVAEPAPEPAPEATPELSPTDRVNAARAEILEVTKKYNVRFDTVLNPNDVTAPAETK